MNIENPTIKAAAAFYKHSRKVQLARAHLAALASEVCISARAHEQREFALTELPALLDSGEIDCTAQGVAIDSIAAAWMMCSYGSSRGKHIVKVSMNRLIERELQAAGTLKDYPYPVHAFNYDYKAPFNATKPRVLVISSFFRSKHAVYRWYGPSIEAMRDAFSLHGLFFTDIDGDAAKVFERVTVAQMVPADFFQQLKSVVQLIESHAPDIILYADAAMHPFSVFTVNMWLAPLQLLLSGHPASSYSRHIDYFLHEQAYADCFGDFTEKPLLFPSEHMAMHRTEKPPVAPRETGNGKIRILAPATLPKLSRPYVSMLGSIMSELSPSKFELHITTHASDEQHAQVSRDITEALGQCAQSNVIIYKRLPTDRYFALVDQCDLFLNPFPFQSSTMIVDCLERGMPGISMCGNELMTRQGAEAMRKFGRADARYIASGEAEYLVKALNLAREIGDVPIPLQRATDMIPCYRVPPCESIYTNPSHGMRDAILRVLG